MGVIADLAAGAKSFPDRPGRDLWREAFGGRDDRGSRRPAPGRARSISGSEAGIVRFLEALRSKAPGGWTDDRYEQGSGRHYNGIAYSAIHRQNELLTQADFRVYRRDPNHPDGRRPVTEADPRQGRRLSSPWDLVRLLDRPNGDDSFGELVAQWNLQLEQTGLALTWMVPNQAGYPVELYPIPTASAVPGPLTNPEYPEGYYQVQPLYPYGPFSTYPSPQTSAGCRLPAQWVMRMKYPHPLLRYDGYSPLTALRLHLDEVEMIDRARHTSMRRVVRPWAALDLSDMEGVEPWVEGELERLKADFEAIHQGPDNVGGLLVPPPGGRVEPWGTTPDQMLFESGWTQLVEFVMGGIGTPKTLAGLLSEVNYATLFATLKLFHWVTLEPKCHRFGGQLTRRLAPFFGDDLIVEVKTKPIDDHDVRKMWADALVGAKAVTKNELRKMASEYLGIPVTREKWGEDIAGDPSPNEQRSQMQERQAQSGVPPLPNGGAGGVPDLEPPEVSESRPGPGPLGEGALGPRKGLFDRLARSGHINGRSLNHA